jgi:hypothetical protein
VLAGPLSERVDENDSPNITLKSAQRRDEMGKTPSPQYPPFQGLLFSCACCRRPAPIHSLAESLPQFPAKPSGGGGTKRSASLSLAVFDDREKMMRRKGVRLYSTLRAIAWTPLGELPLTPPPYQETRPGDGVIGKDDSRHL